MALVEYADAAPEVRAVFDDIKAARGVADVNNFWKALAVDPATLRRTWDSLRAVMAPGELSGPGPARSKRRGNSVKTEGG